MSEERETRLRRLSMRSIRRGIREMDLILADFSSRELADLSEAELDRYEDLLAESDHDLFAWISGQGEVPARHAALVARISRSAVGVTRPG